MTGARQLRTTLLVSLALALWIAPAAATTPQPAKPKAENEVSLRPPKGERSRSVNYPWEGQLVRGLRLRESRHIKYVPSYVEGGNFYGTWQLVQLIERAARRVSARHPGSKLYVGELSSKEGGDIVGHSSHESGRDADIAFYAKRANGRPGSAYGFARFDASGRGLPPNHHLRFDDTRNWELVAKLVNDPDAPVQYIFVARAIKRRLLREAVRTGAPSAVIERAESVLVEPARGNPHRSHFHVRIYCPPADRPMCRDVGPFWAWYPGTSVRHARPAHAATSSALGPFPETIAQRGRGN